MIARELIVVVEDEAMCPVEIGRPILLSEVRGIVTVTSHVSSATLKIGERFAVSVGRLEREPVRELFSHRDLQPVVVAIVIRASTEDTHRPKTNPWNAEIRIACRVRGDQRAVLWVRDGISWTGQHGDVVGLICSHNVISSVSSVADFQYPRGQKLILDIEGFGQRLRGVPWAEIRVRLYLGRNLGYHAGDEPERWQVRPRGLEGGCRLQRIRQTNVKSKGRLVVQREEEHISVGLLIIDAPTTAHHQIAAVERLPRETDPRPEVAQRHPLLLTVWSRAARDTWRRCTGIVRSDIEPDESATRGWYRGRIEEPGI